MLKYNQRCNDENQRNDTLTVNFPARRTEQTEVINVKISTSKLSALGIDPTSIMGILQKQNIQVNTGDIATEIYQLR